MDSAEVKSSTTRSNASKNLYVFSNISYSASCTIPSRISNLLDIQQHLNFNSTVLYSKKNECQNKVDVIAKEEDLKKILPKNGPPKEEVLKYIEKYKNDLIVIKYGGNVFIDRNIFNNFISDLIILNKLGISIIVVHGGGPRIKKELDKSNIQTKFIKGLRVTDEKVINIVEDVLIDFNIDIVNSLKKKELRQFQ